MVFFSQLLIPITSHSCDLAAIASVVTKNATQKSLNMINCTTKCTGSLLLYYTYRLLG